MTRFEELRAAALNLLLAYEQQEDENPYRIELWDLLDRYEREDGRMNTI